MKSIPTDSWSTGSIGSSGCCAHVSGTGNWSARPQYRYSLPPAEWQRDGDPRDDVRYNGTPMTPKGQAAFRRYLDDNPRGKHGRLRYDLKRQFGRIPDEIRSRFAFYFDRFDVRDEA